MLVDGDVLGVLVAEQLQHLAGLGVPTHSLLRVQNIPVDDYVEDTLRPGDQGQFSDDVLVVVHQIVGGAHGAL